MELKKISLILTEEQLKTIDNISKMEKLSKSEVVRKLIDKGLTDKVTTENTEIIAQVVRTQMESILKPHINRLAKISAKAGHMAATSTFLNVQAFMDLVPEEKRKDVKKLYEESRKMAVGYMKTNEFEECEED